MRVVACALVLLATCALRAEAQQPGGVEPRAGSWKTWVIASGAEYRVPPPPDSAATAMELGKLAEMAAVRDRTVLDRIAFWNTGSPSYRWSEIAIAEHLKKGLPWAIAARDLALMHIAIYLRWDGRRLGQQIRV